MMIPCYLRRGSDDLVRGYVNLSLVGAIRIVRESFYPPYPDRCHLPEGDYEFGLIEFCGGGSVVVLFDEDFRSRLDAFRSRKEVVVCPSPVN